MDKIVVEKLLEESRKLLSLPQQNLLQDPLSQGYLGVKTSRAYLADMSLDGGAHWLRKRLAQWCSCRS